ncbi:MAG: DUF2232 domain-containing protein [Deltaproteobacteria bacterium]|nr:DUF2232 domain-containing protein [Deltaproteobacteria bacterium]
MENRRFLLHLLLGTAASVLIFLISLRVPLLGMGVSILTPLPVMVLCHLWGLKGGGLAVLIGSLALSGLLTPLVGVIFFTEFGLLGILLHYFLVKRGLTWDRGILYTSLAVVGGMALLLVLFRLTTSLDTMDWIRGEIRETGETLRQLYPVEETGGQPTWEGSERFVALVLRVFPALIILTIWLEGIVNVSLFTRLTARIDSGQGRVKMRPEFSSWVCPDRFIWGGILGGFLIMTKVSLLVTVGINAVILLVAIYLLQGLAIVSFFFKKRNVPVGLRVLGYALIGIIQFLPVVVAGLGLFDIWIDFRKVRPRLTPYKKTP